MRASYGAGGSPRYAHKIIVGNSVPKLMPPAPAGFLVVASCGSFVDGPAAAMLVARSSSIVQPLVGGSGAAAGRLVGATSGGGGSGAVFALTSSMIRI